MGFLTRLFGGDPSRDWWKRRDEERYEGAKTFLAKVAAAATIENATIQASMETEQLDLRGKLRGFPVHVSLSNTGNVHAAAVEHDGDLEDLRVYLDPKRADAVIGQRDADRIDVCVGAGVFAEGNRAEKRFRALPAELQARVIDEVRRLRIGLWSRKQEVRVSFAASVDAVADPVSWIATSLGLAVDLARARGAQPPGTWSFVTDEDEKRHAWQAGEQLARALAASLGGAEVAPAGEGEGFEVRFIEEGVAVRIIVDVDMGDLDAWASAEGVEGDFDLVREPGASAEGRLGRRIFFGEGVYISDAFDPGHDADGYAERQAALLHRLPPALLAELIAQMNAQPITSVFLDEGEIGGNIGVLEGALDRADRIERAIALARLFARVAAELRGAAVTG